MARVSRLPDYISSKLQWLLPYNFEVAQLAEAIVHAANAVGSNTSKMAAAKPEVYTFGVKACKLWLYSFERSRINSGQLDANRMVTLAGRSSQKTPRVQIHLAELTQLAQKNTTIGSQFRLP